MKKVTIMLTAMAMAVLVGCQTATPSKAQIAEIRGDVNVQSGYSSLVDLMAGMEGLTPEQTIAIFESASSLASATECNVISQTMQNETGGDESNSQTATGPETPVNVSVPTGTDAITALVGASAEGITKGLRDDGQNEADAAASAGEGVDPNCPDGNCSDK